MSCYAVMKSELIHLCEELEHGFDEQLGHYEDRLSRLEQEIDERIQSLQRRYPDDTEILQLQQLNIGLRRTHYLMRGKLNSIRNSSSNLLDELDQEIKNRVPQIKKKIEESDSYEQATIAIQKEAHSGSQTFKDFLKAIMMWKETPEERLETQSSQE